MGKNDIKISPKYGLNPTIPVCFFCGEDKNEIAIMGHVREKDADGKAVRGSDVEMPMRTLLDYEPCDKCKEALKSGIAVIETVTTPTEYPAITRGTYPTGKHVIIKEEAFDRIFKDVDKSKRITLIEPDLFDAIFGETIKALNASDEDSEQ